MSTWTWAYYPNWCKNIKGMELCGNIIQDLTTMFGKASNLDSTLYTICNWWSGIWTQIYQVVLFLAPIRDLLSSRGFLKIVECPSKFFLGKCIYHKRKLDISAGSFTENADLWQIFTYLRPPSWMFCGLSSHTPTAPRQDLRVVDGGGAELRTASALGAGTRTGTWGCF